MLDVLITYW